MAGRAWFKFVIASDDSLHLLLLILAIEWRVAGKEEVGDNTHCPDVHWLPVTRFRTITRQPLKIIVSLARHILFLKISGAM